MKLKIGDRLIGKHSYNNCTEFRSCCSTYDAYLEENGFDISLFDGNQKEGIFEVLFIGDRCILKDSFGKLGVYGKIGFDIEFELIDNLGEI